MYPKGGNMLHTIRQLVGDDEKWRGMLRGLNQTFRHQTVMGKQVEEYLSQQSGLDLSKVFDQYLRTIQIPELEYRISGNTVSYRWANVVPGFAMPVELLSGATGRGQQGSGLPKSIRPTEEWQTFQTTTPVSSLEVDPDYYVTAKRVE
jgi:aminopeptidase N